MVGPDMEDGFIACWFDSVILIQLHSGEWQYTPIMANIYDYDEGEIAAIIICGGLILGLVVCMGMCGVLYG